MPETMADPAGSPPQESPVLAWKRLRPNSPSPTRVQLIKPSRPHKPGKKSYVFRIDGVGEGGSSVIAKLCMTQTAELETLFYSEVLAPIGWVSLHFYGSVPERRADMMWLFIEYAKGDEYQESSEEHSVLAASWLGRLHAAGSDIKNDQLPVRDATQYLEWLRETRITLTANIRSRRDPSELEVLTEVEQTLASIEADWTKIEATCANVPVSVVHGDLKRKHMKIREPGTKPRLAVFDWEFAGRGLIAPDLGGLKMHRNSDRVRAYEREVRPFWPHLGEAELIQITKLGRLLNGIAAVFWASASLRFEYLDKPIRRLRGFNDELARLMRDPTWLQYNGGGEAVRNRPGAPSKPSEAVDRSGLPRS